MINNDGNSSYTSFDSLSNVLQKLFYNPGGQDKSNYYHHRFFQRDFG